MQTERFHGNTMEEALQKVHASVGPDALILSAEAAAPDGVVIVAGSRAGHVGSPARPGNTGQGGPGDPCGSRASLERHLRGQGVLAKVAAAAARQLAAGGGGVEAARRVLSKHVRCRRAAFQEDQMIAVVGPSGVGKTTTLAKLAARMLAQGTRPVALVSLDTFRVGAVDHLRAFAELMEIPFFVAFTPAELRKLAQRLAGSHRILLDTAGRSPYDQQQLGLLRGFLGGGLGVVCYLVLSATTSAHEQVEAVRRFAVLRTESLIMTKIDECSRLGSLVNLPFLTGLSLSHLGTGPDVPRDFIGARPGRIAAALLERDPSRALREVVDE